MQQDAINHPDPGESKFSWLNAYHLGGIERALAAGDYVYPEDLTDALRLNGSRPIPPAVFDYLCRVLEGEIQRPKGRRPRSKVEAQRQQNLVTGAYYRYFDWLQVRRRKYGRPKGLTRGDPAPSEIAARLVARNVFGDSTSWESIRNMVRSRK